jgi:hypothetical protein
MNLTPEQKDKFIYNSARLCTSLLVGAYKAFEKHAMENGSGKNLNMDADMLSIVRHVVFISDAMDPIKEALVEANPDYRELYSWMDKIIEQWQIFNQTQATQEKDATQPIN